MSTSTRIKKIIISTFFGALLLFTGCSSQKERPQDKILNNIELEYTQEISNDLDLTPVYVGSAAMEKVEKLTFGFKSKEQVSETDAYKLIVQCADKLICLVNENEAIRPYLSNYPFTGANIRVGITFSDNSEDLFVPPGYIASASISNGQVRLNKYNPKTEQLEEIFRKPYHSPSN